MVIQSERPRWVDFLENLSTIGDEIWARMRDAIGLPEEQTQKKQLPSRNIRNQNYGRYSISITRPNNASRLDNPIHATSNYTWRDVGRAALKLTTIIGVGAAVISGVMKLATKKRNLYPHYIEDISSVTNIQLNYLLRIGLGFGRVLKLKRVRISDELKGDALKSFNKDVKRGLIHAKLTNDNREDYEMCFIAQEFNGHSVKFTKQNIDIFTIKTCVISQDYHVHNVISKYLNFEHKYLLDKISKNRVLLLDANVLIDYEHKDTKEELKLKADKLIELFDNSAKKNHQIWILDRIASELVDR